MKNLLLTSLLFLSLFHLIAQPSIEWQKTYGGSEIDRAYSIQQTNDGGYIVVGDSNSLDGDIADNNGESDYWIIKLSADNSIEWRNNLGGSDFDGANAVQQTSDGGYIISGFSNSADGDVTSSQGTIDLWIVKLSSIGNLIWQKSLGGTDWDFPGKIKQTLDDGYIVTGYVASTDGDITDNNGDFDLWLVKLDNAGSILWQKCLGGTDADSGYSLEQTTDGGFIISGYSHSNDADLNNNQGLSDYWIVKVDNVGTLEWQKTLGGSDEDFALSSQQTNDGGFIIAGYSSSTDGDVTGQHGESDFWVVKLMGDPVSVNKIPETAMLSVFPNPTKGELNITVVLQFIGKEYTIYNSLGNAIATGKIRHENTSLDLGSLSSGVYIVQIEGQDKMISTRFIIK